MLMYLALEHFINNPDEKALLLQLQVNFEKAFYGVEHEFVFETLEIRLVKVTIQGCMEYAHIKDCRFFSY